MNPPAALLDIDGTLITKDNIDSDEVKTYGIWSAEVK